MDLRTMLNDNSVQKQPPPPRLHTPQTSFDRSAERPTPYDVRPDRRPSYPPSSHVADSRSQTSGYFASQSPQQNSASTPSAGAPSIYAQSPGSHGQLYTPSQHLYPPQYIPSPSLAGPSPSTPVSAQYYQGHSQNNVHGNSYTPTATAPRPPTHDGVSHANGVSHLVARQMSPPAFTHQPVTPLGPPVAYPRPSPQAQRPPSQGYDHLRSSSVSSIGSSHSRDYSAIPMVHPEAPRAGSIQRTYLGDEERQREREQSLESVSPKTIPRPTPQRQSASYSQELPVDTQPPPQPSQPHLYPHPNPYPHQVQPTSQMAIDKSMDGQPTHTAEFSSRPTEHHEHSTMSSGPNSAPRTRNSVTPQSVHSSLPAQPSPPANKQSSLKRSNSILSTPPSSAMPPRKRLRRDEIPIFARSAHREKPIRFSHQGPNIRTSRKSPAPAPKREDDMLPVTNGQASIYGLTELTVPSKPCKEPSITNLVPYDDIVRKVCDWIALTASKKMPPPGSKFELEAKLGRILDQDTSERIRLPVLNEAILDRSRFGAIRFVSTMTEEHHKHYNEFLNGVVAQAHQEKLTTNPDREAVGYKHLKESDEFYELTVQGRKALPQNLTHWFGLSKYAPKVRKTFDLTGEGTLKEQIIKTRIADLEVYNPNTAFDYRISLSLETAVVLEPQHLVAAKENDRDRQKDRLSYRHFYNQIDLTQVSYPGATEKEHELEVEIAEFMIEKELDKLSNRQESSYEELITSFLNNVRLLCRAGT